VNMFAEICKQEPQSHLLLVGRGGNEVEQRVRERAAELGVMDRVTIAGVRSDVPRLLKAANLLVFPSTREGLPGAVLEACAAGIPVLGSDLPGVREIAATFPFVRYLPLTASDQEWASLALTLSQEADTKVFQEMANQQFPGSPFDVKTCSEALCAIWRKASA
jgi:glycosyltransferase involved in cell wall biosynthesis